MQVHSKSSSPLPICVQVAPFSHGFGSHGSTPPISQKSPLNPSGQKQIGGAGSYKWFQMECIRKSSNSKLQLFKIKTFPSGIQSIALGHRSHPRISFSLVYFIDNSSLIHAFNYRVTSQQYKTN